MRGELRLLSKEEKKEKSEHLLYGSARFPPAVITRCGARREAKKEDAIETQISGCRLRRIIIGMWGTEEIRANRAAFRGDRGKSARAKMKRHRFDSTRLIPTLIRPMDVEVNSKYC